jgi:hypothetical protein
LEFCAAAALSQRKSNRTTVVGRPFSCEIHIFFQHNFSKSNKTFARRRQQNVEKIVQSNFLDKIHLKMPHSNVHRIPNGARFAIRNSHFKQELILMLISSTSFPFFACNIFWCASPSTIRSIKKERKRNDC